MIAALEYNRYAIRKRQERATARVPRPGRATATATVTTPPRQPEGNSSYVACCIGYNESAETITQCLRSYRADAGGHCAVYVAMLDGTFEENAGMTRAFDAELGGEASGGGALQHISYEQPLGEMCEAIVQRRITGTRGGGGVREESGESRQAAVDAAVHEVYHYVKERMEAEVRRQTAQKEHAMLSLIVCQPHVGMKEVRFAAWMTSVVLADLLDVEYMWSSDSDSFVTPDCVRDCVAAMVGDATAGASSAAVAVRDPAVGTFLSRLYAGYIQCEGSLRYAASGCVGQNSAIRGPSACYRVHAIRPVLYEWYAQQMFGHKVWVNEDAHMTTLVRRDAWSTLYVPDAILETGPVPSYTAWFKQLTRWERSIHLERLASPLATFDPSQGIVSLLANLRDLFQAPYMFTYIILLATTGHRTPTSHGSLGAEIMLSQLVQKAWNLMRIPDARRDYLAYALAALLYLFAQPFAHIWGLCTLLDDTRKSSHTRRWAPLTAYALLTAWVLLVAVAARNYMLSAEGAL